MIIFWALAALLLASAMWFVLPPLLRTRGRAHPAAERLALIGTFKQQLTELDAGLADGTLAPEQYERSRLELEKRLTMETEDGSTTRAPVATRDARRLALPVTMGLLVMSLAAGWYFLGGKPQTAKAPPTEAKSADAAHPTNQEQVQLMVTRLAARLKDNPRDADGWAMLGRSYSSLKQFDDSVAAFAQAEALNPRDAQLLADYADTLAMAQGKRFDGKPTALIQRALTIDPKNMKALALAGSADFNAGAYGQAVATWQQLLGLLAPESEMAGTVKANIADARLRGGLKETPPGSSTGAGAGAGKSTQAPVVRKPEPVRAALTVKGSVRLIAGLAAKASPTDTVFILARAVDGPTTPLAVIKRHVKDLPVEFTLDDTMATSPETKISKFKLVDIGARISKSGSVTTRSGDLISPPVRATVGGPDVDVQIQGMVR